MRKQNSWIQRTLCALAHVMPQTMLDTHAYLAQTRRVLCMAFVALTLAFHAVACLPSEDAETQAFEHAEAYYRAGNYDRALQGYTRFLKSHPNSPMTKMANMRMRTIHREVRSMLARQDMPRPVYLGHAINATPKTKKSSAPPAKEAP